MPQFDRRTHRAREILSAVGREYPDAWSQAERLRAEAHLPDWPTWCYLPIAGGYAIASRGGHLPIGRAEHPSILAALAAWRMTLGVYWIDPALFDALTDTAIEGEIPSDPLYRMPEWCIYIETPGLELGEAPIRGVWAHMEWDANHGPDELRLLLDMVDDVSRPFGHLVPIPVILGGGGIVGALERLAVSAQKNAARFGAPTARSDPQRYVSLVSAIVSLVLYIGTQASEITGRRGTPGNPVPVRTRRDGWRLFPADGLRTWDVGVRIGAALRAAYQAEQTGSGGTHEGPRPHVRRAHWHGFRSGPRKRPDGSEIPTAERRLDLRWLPPIAVNLDGADSLPAVVRTVK